MVSAAMNSRKHFGVIFDEVLSQEHSAEVRLQSANTALNALSEKIGRCQIDFTSGREILDISPELYREQLNGAEKQIRQIILDVSSFAPQTTRQLAVALETIDRPPLSLSLIHI